MDPETVRAVNAAEEAVRNLVELCRKQGTLYREHRRSAAQVSRNSKWLLNAIAVLRDELDNPTDVPTAG
jgi:hypothetical protein